MLIKFVVYLLLVFLPYSLHAMLSIGSDTAPSREAFIEFSGVGNIINGFAAMYNGFSLADAVTIVTFNSYFPVSGAASLKGGTCSLQHDLTFDSQGQISSAGIFDGNNYTIEWLAHDDTILMPNLGKITLLDFESEERLVYTVDWSQDNTYIASGTVSHPGDELRVYEFNEGSLTSAAGNSPGTTINHLAWQPVSQPPYYFVAGTSAGLRAYQFTLPSTLSQTGSIIEIGTTFNAIAWHPAGNLVAGGKTSGTQRISIYNFVGGILSSNYNLTFEVTVQRGAMDFDYTGEYLAVGVNSDNRLRLIKWNGTILSEVTPIGVTLSDPVTAVRWSPDGSLLAVGLNSSTERLRVYSFNRTTETLTEVESYRVGEALTVFSIDWRSDGKMLAVGRERIGIIRKQLRIFSVDTYAQRLFPSAESTLESEVAICYSTRWSPNDQYVVTGSSSKNVTVFNFQAGEFIFNNADLVFNSPVQLVAPFIFQGNCTINFHGKTFDLSDQYIEVGSGASLLIQNCVLQGLTGTNLRCLDSAATCSMSNVVGELSGDYSFNEGHLAIVGDVLLTGTHTVTYGSDQTSTIYANGKLKFDRDMTFNYAPAGGANNLLAFVDEKSTLHVYEATLHAPSTGLRLTKGNLVIEGMCPFFSDGADANNGIWLGNGAAADDLKITVLPESGISTEQGYVVYKNVN